jgi:predicted metal-dependent hydrolase
MQIEYSIVRSAKRKKLTIPVERDQSIVVHSPEGNSEESIRRVVDGKRQWLFEKLRHPQKYRKRPHAPGKEVVSGESAPYLGRDYRIEIGETASGQIEFSQGFRIPVAEPANRRKVLRAWYIAQAKLKIPARVKAQAEALGAEYSGVRIVDNRYRWGSCTPKNNLNFNWRLIKAPMFVIDYVIAHELAHLLEANHTPRFWNIVRAASPNMEKARLWLKENGQLLEEEL